MHHRFSLLFFLVLMFVVCANNAWACGKDASAECGSPATGKTCCSEQNDSQSSCCSKINEPDKQLPDQKCGDQNGCSGCHCPCSSVTINPVGGMLSESPVLLITFPWVDNATLRQVFYFAQHMPKDVYFAIWQPPQLNA